LPLQQTPIYKVEQELGMTNTISIKQLVNAQVLNVGDKVYYAPNSSLDESKVRTGNVSNKYNRWQSLQKTKNSHGGVKMIKI
jgi:hypothetical protein